MIRNIYMYIYICIYIYVYIWGFHRALYQYLYIYLSLSRPLSIYLSIYLSIHPSIYRISIYSHDYIVITIYIYTHTKLYNNWTSAHRSPQEARALSGNQGPFHGAPELRGYTPRLFPHTHSQRTSTKCQWPVDPTTGYRYPPSLWQRPRPPQPIAGPFWEIQAAQPWLYSTGRIATRFGIGSFPSKTFEACPMLHPALVYWQFRNMKEW